ncbi:hypothetical protein F4780DRAFT_58182 [Xylariomycetidae sp. FL0641]|nr:hypothetical protein F4780DRAFT_58182 [Xylariomycetidae sp. FL0641]
MVRRWASTVIGCRISVPCVSIPRLCHACKATAWDVISTFHCLQLAAETARIGVDDGYHCSFTSKPPASLHYSCHHDCRTECSTPLRDVRASSCAAPLPTCVMPPAQQWPTLIICRNDPFGSDE